MSNDSEFFSLKNILKRSAQWSAFSVIVRHFSQFAITILLARYLTPEDFASSSIALSIIGLFTIISQFGVSQTIIVFDNADKDYLDTINCLMILVGIFFYIVLFAIAPFFDNLYHALNIGIIIQVSGLSILTGLIASVPTAILQKNLDFSSLSLTAAITSVFHIIVTYIFIELNLGIWAIVIPPIIIGLLGCIFLYYFSSYKPSFRMNKTYLKLALPYGKASVYSSILNHLSSNIILLSMGRIWTPTQVGHYAFVDAKILKPYELVVLTLFSNLTPILSRIAHERKRLGEVYLRINRLAIYAIVSLHLVLIQIVHILIPLMFGYNWVSTIKLFQILLLVPVVRSVGFGANALFLSLKSPKQTWQINLVRFILYCILVVFALNTNLQIEIVAVCVVLIEAFVGLINIYCVLKLLGISASSYLIGVKNDLLFVILFAVGLYCFSKILEFFFVTDVVILGLFLGFSLLYFITLLHLFHGKNFFLKLKSIIR
jgi:teichuronic acid exporter